MGKAVAVRCSRTALTRPGRSTTTTSIWTGRGAGRTASLLMRLEREGHRTMTTEVRVTIVAWADDHQPGFVACSLIDADRREHLFIDKVPIFTAADLDRDSAYPQPGWLACMVLDRYRDAQGRAVVIIDTAQPDGVASTVGETRFTVLDMQVVVLPAERC